jgi:hypothetical protein
MTGFDLIIQPDATEPDAAEVLVDGSIDGKPYRFLLDTGAASTCVTADPYIAQFESTQQRSSSGLFAKSNDDLITVPRLELGPISRQDFTLVRISGKHPRPQNLIGMDLLKDHRCHFRFDANYVDIDGEATSEGFQPLLLDNKYHPFVDVWLGSVKAAAVWDTGAGMTVVDTALIARHPMHFQEVGQSSGMDSTGTEMETPMYKMAAVTIGDVLFPAQKVAAVDLSFVNSTIEAPMNMILGYPTLCRANWLFDFPGKRWAITKQLFEV